MENYKSLNRMVARLFVAVVVLSEAICGFGACKVPHYRRGRTREDNASNIDIDISIRLQDFAPERLICLAGALRQKYPERNVAALIFSSREAALGYVPVSVEQIPVLLEYQSKLHGYYFYNREKQEDYLLIVPDGGSQEVDSPFDTRIDLPATRTPVCRLASNGRCLLEFQHVYYPSIDGRAEVSGRVTLSGSIRPDGALSGLAVVDATASPPERQPVLVDWARQHLGTWRFEPGKHKDDVRITYYFEVVDSPFVGHGTSVQFRLPYEVRIETGRTQ
jgi:Gram-negative bacterial TonB protein C-terminal